MSWWTGSPPAGWFPPRGWQPLSPRSSSAKRSHLLDPQTQLMGQMSQKDNSDAFKICLLFSLYILDTFTIASQVQRMSDCYFTHRQYSFTSFVLTQLELQLAKHFRSSGLKSCFVWFCMFSKCLCTFSPAFLLLPTTNTLALPTGNWDEPSTCWWCPLLSPPETRDRLQQSSVTLSKSVRILTRCFA